MSDLDTFNENIILLTPSGVIFYMLDEATRRTDNAQNSQEFGWAGTTFFHHVALDQRIDEYIQRLIDKEINSALDIAKLQIRGEGEPGNAGEMINTNYVEEILEALKRKDKS